MLGSTAAVSAFFVVYFHLLLNPFFPVRVMWVLPIDLMIPVLSWTVWVYFTLWIYICLPVSLMAGRSALWHYLQGGFVLAVLGMAIFAFYPTAVPELSEDWRAYPRTLSFLKSIDSAGNACPSLHVAYAIFSGLWLGVMLQRVGGWPGWRFVNVLWGAAIVVSTLTTKQHVFLDLLPGALLGGLVFYWNLSRIRRAGVAL